jgi:hypothetical protein
MKGNTLIDNFLAEQVKLVKAKQHSIKAAPHIVKPEAPDRTVMFNPDDEYNNIIEKKPSKKCVERFLQSTINMIMEENE